MDIHNKEMEQQKLLDQLIEAKNQNKETRIKFEAATQELEI